jgi:hypothetical protein
MRSRDLRFDRKRGELRYGELDPDLEPPRTTRTPRRNQPIVPRPTIPWEIRRQIYLRETGRWKESS